ncbi:cell division cycle-associated protein 4 isoform X2 [Chionomys nivalis]|uniref:cell division cycle-associated protein 4 isoform X2 n=1 Tax=Chionomys nivalis TaxID=269649 RepID=UPI002591B21B|nr:cell division cycle-associated protein 4 isoform X2 [Chionomys nivalis]
MGTGRSGPARDPNGWRRCAGLHAGEAPPCVGLNGAPLGTPPIGARAAAPWRPFVGADWSRLPTVWRACLAAQFPQDTMFARGLKRKYGDQEEGVEGFGAVPSYCLQRQSLLDMSLVKLQLCHMLVEPNLCRSVLIANTVRQIQEEMSRDGVWHGMAPQNVEQRAPIDRLVSTEILCRTARGTDGEHPTPELEDDPLQSSASELPIVSSAQGQRNPQSSLWEIDNPQENRGSFQKSLDQIFETLENKTPSSVEELFSDVDSSYYDLDTVLTGMMSGTKPSLCNGLESFAAAPPPPSSTCKSDLAELDHVVEILVET